MRKEIKDIKYETEYKITLNVNGYDIEFPVENVKISKDKEVDKIEVEV